MRQVARTVNGLKVEELGIDLEIKLGPVGFYLNIFNNNAWDVGQFKRLVFILLGTARNGLTLASLLLFISILSVSELTLLSKLALSGRWPFIH
jgi:hypothetical protein